MDHPLASLPSAAASAIVSPLPALLISRPIPQIYVLIAPAFGSVSSTFILLLGLAVIAVGAFYNFRLVGLTEITFISAINQLETPENCALSDQDNVERFAAFCICLFRDT